MNTPFFMKLLPYALFLYSSLSLGAVPITVTFNSGTTSFASNGSGTANYVVNVKGIVPPNAPLTFNSNPNSSNGLTANQVSTGSSLCSGVSTVCASPTFSLKANQSCCLQYALAGSQQGSYTLQPLVSSTPVDTYRAKALSPTSITVSGVANTTPLTATPATLALSVDCPSAGGSCAYANAALTGKPREITITNTSLTDTTTPLTVTSASFPTGTSITTDNCTGIALAPQGTCTITIKPGQEASQGAGNASCTTGIQPNPGTVTVNASSAPSPTSSNVDVLSYGCIYQEGYVYSVDDTTAPTGSIGGNVVNINNDLTNQLNLPWDSSDSCVNNGNCTDVPSATNTLNGSGNTTAIVAALTGKTGVTATNYAAGYCTTYTIDSTGNSPCTNPSSPTCYKNWYSPAICEVGPSGLAGSGVGANCPSSTQNLYSNLFLNSQGQFASNFYWSSTQSSADYAWYQNFVDGGQYSNFVSKSSFIGVRCVRAITP
jgi:hypothetical protein